LKGKFIFMESLFGRTNKLRAGGKAERVFRERVVPSPRKDGRRKKMKHRFKKGEDPQIICRRALLNTLIRGPVAVESIVASAERDFGFRREDVFAAAQWFNVVEEWRDGQRIWRKPDVLAVLPKWNYSRRADRAAAGVA
jgi:hypothetical protein